VAQTWKVFHKLVLPSALVLNLRITGPNPSSPIEIVGNTFSDPADMKALIRVIAHVPILRAYRLPNSGLVSISDSPVRIDDAEDMAHVAPTNWWMPSISGCSGVWIPPPKYRNKEACNQETYLDADLYPVPDRRGISMNNPMRPPV
jgi:hypothetical protein